MSRLSTFKRVLCFLGDTYEVPIVSIDYSILLLTRLNPGLYNMPLAYGQRLFTADVSWRKVAAAEGRAGRSAESRVGRGGGTAMTKGCRRVRNEGGGHGGRRLNAIGRSVPCNWIRFGATTTVQNNTHTPACTTTVLQGVPAACREVPPHAGKIVRKSGEKNCPNAACCFGFTLDTFAATQNCRQRQTTGLTSKDWKIAHS